MRQSEIPNNIQTRADKRRDMSAINYTHGKRTQNTINESPLSKKVDSAVALLIPKFLKMFLKDQLVNRKINC